MNRTPTLDSIRQLILQAWNVLPEIVHQQTAMMSMPEKVMHLIVAYAIDLEFDGWVIITSTVNPITGKMVQRHVNYSDGDGHDIIQAKTYLAVVNVAAEVCLAAQEDAQ